ncbi:unnamed protein product [Cuscuta campestris]|uniref:Uncharacterized protein n=1 Tax=Cuscuta campestris TaxID=132261 RepID=A0A484N7X5_9ASTE|nr:unnamed protein product [Cuscuta campestris]
MPVLLHPNTTGKDAGKRHIVAAAVHAAAQSASATTRSSEPPHHSQTPPEVYTTPSPPASWDLDAGIAGNQLQPITTVFGGYLQIPATSRKFDVTHPPRHLPDIFRTHPDSSIAEFDSGLQNPQFSTPRVSPVGKVSIPTTPGFGLFGLDQFSP